MSNDESVATGNGTSTDVSPESAANIAPVSWNPALRPDTATRHQRNTSTASNDDFFDRYPDSTPEKSRQRQQEVVVEEEDADEEQDHEDPESRRRQRSISVKHAIAQRSETASPDILTRVPMVETAAEGLISRPDSVDIQTGGEFPAEDEAVDEEAAIFKPGDTAQEQDEELDQVLPLPSKEPMYIGTPGMHTPMPLEDELAKHLGYDYQGEILDMEDAVDEAPDAPLLDDEEPPPMVEELKREPTMRTVSEQSLLTLEERSAPQQQSVPKAKTPFGFDRSFTSNFTDLPTPVEKEEPQEHEVPISNGWPSAGDDKTFGELLDHEQADKTVAEEASASEQQTTSADDGWGAATSDDAFGELLGDSQIDGSVSGQSQRDTIPKGSRLNGEEDLAAIWGAALDDDDLLEDTNELDPSTLFGDDDPGFLEDEFLSAVPAASPAPSAQNPQQKSASPYVPASATQQAPQVNQYAAPGLQMLGSNHARGAATPSTGLYDVYGHGTVAQTPPASQRPNAQSSQSFVDKAKGGYQSPYDLPMDVVKKPKQRPRPTQNISQPVGAPTPPPRSSSIPLPPGQASQPPPGPSNLPPLSSSGGGAPPPPTTTAATGPVPAKTTPQSGSGFFEDLPVTSKPRTRPGAYAPQPAPSPPPGQFAHPPLTRGVTAPPMQPPRPPSVPLTPAQQQQSTFGGLTRQPDRLQLLPDQPEVPVQNQPSMGPPPSQRYSPSTLPTPAPTQNRFSPAPPSQPPAAVSRYSPAPASQQPGVTRKPSVAGPPGIREAHLFAPRTSSPLAFQADKHQPLLPGSPPKTNGSRSSGTMSPERSVSFGNSPASHRTQPSATVASPPQRPSTQSPPNVMKAPRYSQPQLERSLTAAPTTQTSHHLPHRRQFSKDIGFARPTDERIQDPLERWKGNPIFRWGESGVILSSVPKQTPFYAAGGGTTIKCTPGAVSVQQATTFMPMDDRNAKFPGPLTARAKGKKKEVVTWMTGKIEDLEKRAELARMDFQADADLAKRTEERVVLWKLVKIFVEHDGRLEGDKNIEDEVRAVLLPNLAQMSQAMELQSPLSATSQGVQPESVERTAILQLRQALLEGQRERAVWIAEEKKLWGHAMLISSTMGADIWKQIIQSFVRSQVKTIGSDARSLAALYQVFAGNAEDCVDELVPPSARSGFQMVSKSGGAVSGNPLEGLDQWRETLGLVAGNRTNADAPSLVALGKLLSSYGRAEAAHSCFLFARQTAKHTGPDDSEANFVILGANHQSQTESFANDLDAIILTEIFEWASSLSAPSSAVHYIPHLQSFKLLHAQELAAYGLRKEAQAYCDHITTAYTSTTRPSPYYHPTFTQAVNDLGAFLSQTPQPGSGGIMSSITRGKVSSGAASWFTKFVAGDDDQESTGSGPGAGSDDMMSGPFGKVNGDSPVLSRTGSTTELYNPMMTGATSYGAPPSLGTPLSTPPQQFAPSSGPTKYAPISGAGRYAPAAPGVMNAAAAQPPDSPQRPSSARNYTPASGTQPINVQRSDSSRVVSDYSAASYAPDSRRSSAQIAGWQSSYEPKPALAEDTPAFGGYQPMITEQQNEVPPAFAQSRNVAPHEEHEEGEQEPDPEDGGYQAPTAGYEPPSYGGYEPPSYQPYQPDPEADDDAPKPRKKMLDDDEDDDFAKRSEAMKKSEADRQADEAFRKAAEADAQRDKGKAGGEKKGWLGGWFGGAKKDQNMPTVHKAKLGEENSFYYDENLKKWVNKKGGSDAGANAAAPTPPPPRMGPPHAASRSTSAIMGPPSGPPSRSSSGAGPPMGSMRGPPSAMGSPAFGGMASGPPSRTATPDGPPMPAAVAALSGGNGPPSAPPSRPSTSMSNASDLDDLMSGAPARGQKKVSGAAKSKKKGGRYVDVMGNK